VLPTAEGTDRGTAIWDTLLELETVHPRRNVLVCGNATLVLSTTQGHLYNGEGTNLYVHGMEEEVQIQGSTHPWHLGPEVHISPPPPGHSLTNPSLLTSILTLM